MITPTAPEASAAADFGDEGAVEGRERLFGLELKLWGLLDTLYERVKASCGTSTGR
jgi:hypothetical protein